MATIRPGAAVLAAVFDGPGPGDMVPKLLLHHGHALLHPRPRGLLESRPDFRQSASVPVTSRLHIYENPHTERSRQVHQWQRHSRELVENNLGSHRCHVG